MNVNAFAIFIFSAQFNSGTDQGPVVQRVDCTVHWTNHYPLDNSIGFASTYPVDSDLSALWYYPIFEQLRSV